MVVVSLRAAPSFNNVLACLLPGTDSVLCIPHGAHAGYLRSLG
jgi:hypothetical protein